MSSVVVKVQRKGQMVLPRSLREEAGVSEGTLLKIAVLKGGQFLLTPQLTIDRSLITGGRKDKQALNDLAAVVSELRAEAKAKGIDNMPQREIDRATKSARRRLSGGPKPSGK